MIAQDRTDYEFRRKIKETTELRNLAAVLWIP